MTVRVRAASAFVLVGLIAAACSGGGSHPSGGTTGTTPGSSSPPVGTPKVGGALVMGTEAEIDGFDPTKNRWDVTGLMYASTVYDPLAFYGKDNQVHPYLAQSITPSSDYKTWTIKLRPNITFSNGDPLTADAVVADLQALAKAALTAPALSNMASVAKVDDLTAVVTAKTAWVPFPVYMTGQLGVVFDPKMLTDPNSAQDPIGTGPFVKKEWVPGNHFLATKNPSYWQRGLPYLDSVEYRPLLEVTTRDNSLASGTIDILHSSDVQTEQDLKGNSSVTLISDANVTARTEAHFIMLNTGKAPLDDPVLRQALAYATDAKKIIDTIDFGLEPVATGPFNAHSDWAGDTGYPGYDLAKAKQLVQQYEQQHGVTSVSFELGTTNNGRNLADMSLIQDMWKQAGITVTIKQVEQSQYILNALVGKYQAYDWRQFGEPDPDADVVWWSSANAAAEGQLSLNFSRIKDPQVDTDLQTGRTSPDPAARKAAYQDIAKRFATDVPFVWINQTVWEIGSRKNIHGVTDWTLPDGTPGVDHTIGGVFLVGHVWKG